MRKLGIYLFFIINLLIIIWFWYDYSGILLSSRLPSVLLALGRLSGLLAVYFLMVQVMLMGRAIWLERTFGLDKLSNIHRLNGYLSLSFILFHPTLLIISSSLFTNTNLISRYLYFITNKENVLQASIAVLLFIIIVGISVNIARKRLKYEIWYFVHLFTYLAIFLAWGHQLKIGEDFLGNNLFRNYWYFLYTFVFTHQLIFRFGRQYYKFLKHRFYIEKIETETHEVTSIYITGRNIEEFKIKPGQFMIFRFLNNYFWWQAHPFSLSIMPDGKRIRISVKNSGDFTSQIAKIKKGTYVIIDGPYGIFTKDKIKKEKVLLIAGGIGITPLRSLYEQLVKNNKEVVLLYSNKTEKDIVFKKELDSLIANSNSKIFYFLSQEKKDGYIFGRINKEMIYKLVKDVADRDVYICGPIPLIDSVKNDLHALNVPSAQIHFEKFSLA